MNDTFHYDDLGRMGRRESVEGAGVAVDGAEAQSTRPTSVTADMRMAEAIGAIQEAHEDVITAAIVLREVMQTVDSLYAEPNIHRLSMPARLRLDQMKGRAEFALGRLRDV